MCHLYTIIRTQLCNGSLVGLLLCWLLCSNTSGTEIQYFGIHLHNSLVYEVKDIRQHTSVLIVACSVEILAQ